MIHGSMKKDSSKHVSRSLEGGKRKHPSTFLQRKGKGRHADTVIQVAEIFMLGIYLSDKQIPLRRRRNLNGQHSQTGTKGF